MSEQDKKPIGVVFTSRVHPGQSIRLLPYRFHQSEIWGDYVGRLSPAQLKRADRNLCGVRGCECGGIYRAPETVELDPAQDGWAFIRVKPADVEFSEDSPKTEALRAKEYEARQARAGLVRVHLWVPSDKVEAIKTRARLLRMEARP